LLLRLQGRLALRGLPYGWTAWARLLFGGALALALLGPAAGHWYARETAHLTHLFLGGPRGRAGAAALLARGAALASAAILILDSIAYAQIVHHPDIETLARTPLAPRTILAARAGAGYAMAAPLLLVASLPLVVGLDRSLGLGWGALCAGLALLLLLPARGLTAFLAPLLVCGAGVASTLQGHGAHDASGVTGIIASVSTAWTDSPLAWVGRALAEVATDQPLGALRNVGRTIALASAAMGLAAILARDLFAAGVVAYRAAPSGSQRRARGSRTAVRPTVSPSIAAVVRAPTLAGPRVSRDASPWRPLLGKEWRLSRRDGTMRGRLAFGLVGVALAFSTGIELAGARGADPPSTAAMDTVMAALTAGATSAGLYILLLFGVGGLLSALLEAAWAREAAARDVLARSPLPLPRVLLALGAFYAVPGILGALALATAGTLLLGRPVIDIALAAPALAGGLAMLCGATLTATSIWPARNASTTPVTLVPHSWRARVVMGAADILVSIACEVPLTVALTLAGARQPALALAVALVPLGLAAAVLTLCLRVATRRLDRLLTNAS